MQQKYYYENTAKTRMALMDCWVKSLVFHEDKEEFIEKVINIDHEGFETKRLPYLWDKEYERRVVSFDNGYSWQRYGYLPYHYRDEENESDNESCICQCCDGTGEEYEGIRCQNCKGNGDTQ
jgi:hypothetical protein